MEKDIISPMEYILSGNCNGKRASLPAPAVSTGLVDRIRVAFRT